MEDCGRADGAVTARYGNANWEAGCHELVRIGKRERACSIAAPAVLLGQQLRKKALPLPSLSPSFPSQTFFALDSSLLSGTAAARKEGRKEGNTHPIRTVGQASKQAVSCSNFTFHTEIKKTDKNEDWAP